MRAVHQDIPGTFAWHSPESSGKMAEHFTTILVAVITGLFTIVLLPLLFLALKRRYFPGVPLSSVTGQAVERPPTNLGQQSANASDRGAPAPVMTLRLVFIDRLKVLGEEMLKSQSLPPDELYTTLASLKSSKYRGSVLRHLASWTKRTSPCSHEAEAARDRMFAAIRDEAIGYIRRDAEAWREVGRPYDPGLPESVLQNLLQQPPGGEMCRYLAKWFDNA